MMTLGFSSSLKNIKQDIIIVDTAGRHKEEKDLLNEMKQISAVVEPDEVMLVIDGTIGQQAKESPLSKTTEIGSIIDKA